MLCYDQCIRDVILQIARRPLVDSGRRHRVCLSLDGARCDSTGNLRHGRAANERLRYVAMPPADGYGGVIRRRDIERFKYSLLTRNDEQVLRDVRLPPITLTNRVVRLDSEEFGRHAPNNTPIGTADSASRLGLHGREMYNRRESQGQSVQRPLAEPAEAARNVSDDVAKAGGRPRRMGVDGGWGGWSDGDRERENEDGDDVINAVGGDDGNGYARRASDERQTRKTRQYGDGSDQHNNSSSSVPKRSHARLPPIDNELNPNGGDVSGFERTVSGRRHERLSNGGRNDVSRDVTNSEIDNDDDDNGGNPPNRYGDRFGDVTRRSGGRRQVSRGAARALGDRKSTTDDGGGGNRKSTNDDDDGGGGGDCYDDGASTALRASQKDRTQRRAKHRSSLAGGPPSRAYLPMSMSRKLAVFKRDARLAYGKAVAAAEARRTPPPEAWMLGQRITRAYVFSYFEHPTGGATGAGAPTSEAKRTKKKRKKATPMEHILGSDISVHDFYPGGKRNLHAFYETQ